MNAPTVVEFAGRVAEVMTILVELFAGRDHRTVVSPVALVARDGA
ncbi:unannotated protein [freshwater metagenome]|uniref:Unannotated protein n=1 Tax=freshwater metagenome TaxID=449393 RepID=A0A6J6HNZ9_9ZZZZ